MDDFWIATGDSPEEVKRHIQAIHDFLDACEAHSYFLKPSKCQIMQPKMTLLGWEVTAEGLRIDPDKVAGIAKWPRILKSVKEVRQALGVLGYQRPFIKGFAHLARPLTELTKKDVPFSWTNLRERALDHLIKQVTEKAILAYPDFSKQFELEVDASAFAVGAILFQRTEEGKKRDVAYYSHALNPAERNYDVWDREFLAIVKALKKWRPLLIGTNHKIIIWTDHSNLQYYHQPQKVN